MTSKRNALVLATCLLSAPVLADELAPLTDIDPVSVTSASAVSVPEVEVLEIAEPTVFEVKTRRPDRALPWLLQGLWAACAMYAAAVFGSVFVRGMNGRRGELAKG